MTIYEANSGHCRRPFSPDTYFSQQFTLVSTFLSRAAFLLRLSGRNKTNMSPSFYPWKKFSCYASRSFDGRVSLWPLFSMASIYPSTIRFTMLAGSRATKKTAKIQMKLDGNVFKMLSVNWWVFRERIIDVISPRWKEAGAFPGILPLADWESNEYYILLKKKSCKRNDIRAVPSTP